MAGKIVQPWANGAWELVRAQHGVVARRQLLGLGMTKAGIDHRLAIGRLRQVHQGVYVVGRSELSRHGQLMAAVLTCGPDARLSHRSGAELWGLCKRRDGPIDVTLPSHVNRRHPEVKIHRSSILGPPRVIDEIPVSDPVSILVDLATCLSDEGIEEAVNEADHLRLVSTDRLPSLLDAHPRRPGRGRLRRILAAQTFSRSQTALERRFLPIAHAAGLPRPTAQAHLGTNRVDFHWPELGLVVETDSLTYHRTAAAQTTDLKRDQTHARAGLRTLRFTHLQVFRQPAYVRAVLEDTARHLSRR